MSVVVPFGIRHHYRDVSRGRTQLADALDAVHGKGIIHRDIKGNGITDFKSERIYDFHWSFDGKQLALARGHADSDVVLIRDTQP